MNIITPLWGAALCGMPTPPSAADVLVVMALPKDSRMGFVCSTRASKPCRAPLPCKSRPGTGNKAAGDPLRCIGSHKVDQQKFAARLEFCQVPQIYLLETYSKIPG